MTNLDDLVAQATNGITSPPLATKNGNGDGRNDPLPSEPKTEYGYARRLIHLYGDRLRYVPDWNRWLVWDGKRWAQDRDGQHERWMKCTARLLTIDAMAITDPDMRRAALREAKRSESNAGVKGALNLASTEPELTLIASHLDADPYLLNCQNGTLDLRAGHLRPHDPADRLTKIARAAYRPDATGTEFQAFLADIQPREDMQRYLARLLGHTLEGRQAVHILPILCGKGGNGKTTLVDAVVSSLGDYAASAATGLLTARSFDAHPTETADLFGKRLSVVHETDEGRRLAEATVKRLTGGDRIKARHMREDFWEFDPSHTFLMLTNHKPEVNGTDEGIWRRLKLVPFDETIEDHKQDMNLPDKLAREADAVLSWLVGGYQQWRQDGLDEPDRVKEATAEYRGECDVLSGFLEDRCLLQPNYSTRSSDLYSAWLAWCTEQGEIGRAGSNKAFSGELKSRGYTVKPTNRGNYVVGIGLAAQGEPRGEPS